MRKFKYLFVKYLFNKCFVVSNLCDYGNCSKINSKIEKTGLKLHFKSYCDTIYTYMFLIYYAVSAVRVSLCKLKLIS